MSAPCAWAARKTLRPMRPKPLIPTRTGIVSTLSGATFARSSGRGAPGGGGRGYRSLPRRRPLDVAVLDVDDVALVAPVAAREVLGDGDGAVPAARAAD